MLIYTMALVFCIKYGICSVALLPVKPVKPFCHRSRVWDHPRSHNLGNINKRHPDGSAQDQACSHYSLGACILHSPVLLTWEGFLTHTQHHIQFCSEHCQGTEFPLTSPLKIWGCKVLQNHLWSSSISSEWELRNKFDPSHSDENWHSTEGNRNKRDTHTKYACSQVRVYMSYWCGVCITWKLMKYFNCTWVNPSQNQPAVQRASSIVLHPQHS